MYQTLDWTEFQTTKPMTNHISQRRCRGVRLSTPSSARLHGTYQGCSAWPSTASASDPQPTAWMGRSLHRTTIHASTTTRTTFETIATPNLNGPGSTPRWVSSIPPYCDTIPNGAIVPATPMRESHLVHPSPSPDASVIATNTPTATAVTPAVRRPSR